MSKTREEEFFQQMLLKMIESHPHLQADRDFMGAARVVCFHIWKELYVLVDTLERRAYKRGYMAGSREKDKKNVDDT